MGSHCPNILGGHWGVRAPAPARGVSTGLCLWERRHQEQVFGRNQEGPSSELQSREEGGAEAEATQNLRCDPNLPGVLVGPGRQV